MTTAGPTQGEQGTEGVLENNDGVSSVSIAVIVAMSAFAIGLVCTIVAVLYGHTSRRLPGGSSSKYVRSNAYADNDDAENEELATIMSGGTGSSARWSSQHGRPSNPAVDNTGQYMDMTPASATPPIHMSHGSVRTNMPRSTTPNYTRPDSLQPSPLADDTWNHVQAVLLDSSHFYPNGGSGMPSSFTAPLPPDQYMAVVGDNAANQTLQLGQQSSMHYHPADLDAANDEDNVTGFGFEDLNDLQWTDDETSSDSEFEKLAALPQDEEDEEDRVPEPRKVSFHTHEHYA